MSSKVLLPASRASKVELELLLSSGSASSPEELRENVIHVHVPSATTVACLLSLHSLFSVRVIRSLLVGV